MVLFVLLGTLLFLSSLAERLPLTHSLRKGTQQSSDLSLYSSQSTKIEVYNSLNLMYYATLSVGTPSEEFLFILDTGSSYIWLVSDDCDCHFTSKHFNSSSSSSYYSLSKQIDLEYGQGSVSGNLSEETIKLGSLTAKNQPFVLSFKDRDLESLESEGLLGLAFSALSDGYPTFIETLKAQKTIPQALFSLYLDSIFEGESTSFITIGEIDLEKSQGAATQINIIGDYGYWLAFCEYTKIGGYKFESTYGLLDIGTSMIYGPRPEINEFQSLIKKSKVCYDFGYLICECRKGEYSKYPVFIISLGGNEYRIRPESYIYYENGYCYVLFYPSDEFYWLIGQPLFREYYSVYDMDNLIVTMHENYPESRWGFYIIIIVVFVVVATIIGLVAFFMIKKKKKSAIDLPLL